jgi:CelD/BcsL family acetyltransferase involved in cellulose biosynthesis
VYDARGQLSGVLSVATMRFGPFEFRAAGGYYLPYRGVALAAPVESTRAACAALADALVDYTPWRLGLRIGPVSDQDRSWRALAAALRTRRWLVGMRRLGQCMVVDVPRTLTEFSQLSASMIKRINYHERRMRRIGRLEINEYRSVEHNHWQSVLLDAATVERNSWVSNETGGNILFDSDAGQKFWNRVVDDEFVSSALSLWLIYFDGQPASFSLTLDVGERKFILANLYDERFKDHSTGNILAYHVICRAIEEGRKVIDWGLGDSGYKRRWGAKLGPILYDLVALPPGPIGRLVKWGLERRWLFEF